MVTQHPASGSKRTHQNFVLSVAADSAPAAIGAPTYYWRHNGVTVTDGGPYLGAQTSTLFINPTSSGVGGTYDAVCINTCGYVTSNPATLTIICPADYNGDGVVNVQDIFAFLSGWFAQDIAADWNANATIAVQDIFDYLAAWFLGC